MIRRVINSSHQRTAHIRDGRFVRVLGPGIHWVWTLWGLDEFVQADVRGVIESVDTGDLIPDDVEGTASFEVGETERCVVFVNSVLTYVLGPGRYRQWSVAARVYRRVFDVQAEPVALSEEDQLGVHDQWSELVCDRGQALLLTRNARPVRTLEAGRYRFWDAGPWSCNAIALNIESLEIAVQDLVSADQVPVRIKPVATFRVTDPLIWWEAKQPRDILYTAVQLALRESVAARGMDALLAERAAISTELLERARFHLPELGVSLESAAIKDVILPGEVKEQFNKVTVARKEAEAEAIRRREEVAHTRQLSNTAKLLAGNPVLMRLKEMEQIAELASHVDKLTLVGGGELVQNLLGSRLISDD